MTLNNKLFNILLRNNKTILIFNFNKRYFPTYVKNERLESFFDNSTIENINKNKDSKKLVLRNQMPGYYKPIPIDQKTGYIIRDEIDPEQQFNWKKTNKQFRKRLVHIRRRLSNQLLFGQNANKLINKYNKGGNQKQLQRFMINGLYQLKLNKFKIQHMDIDEKLSQKQAKESQTD